MKRKWIFYSVLASAGLVLPFALASVPDASAATTEGASQETIEDASKSTDATDAVEDAASSSVDAVEDAASKSADAVKDAVKSAADAASDAMDSKSEAGTPDVAAGADATPEEYVVQEGDTLGDIAREYLGSVEAWPRIAKLNDIDDPTQLSIGTRLKLPQH